MNICPAAAGHGDFITNLYQEAGDIHLAAVHSYVAMAHQLPRLRPGRRITETVDSVVEPALYQRQQFLAGRALHSVGLLEIEPELALEYSVDALNLLFFAELLAIPDQLRSANITSVLA